MNHFGGAHARIAPIQGQIITVNVHYKIYADLIFHYSDWLVSVVGSWA